MNKTGYLDELYQHLGALPKAERQQHIDYYEEMIDDRMEDGLTEEDAVAALGSAADIAAQILGEIPQKPARKLHIWGILLIVLGSPIWLSLLLGVAMVVLSIVLIIVMAYISLWAVILTLYATDLSLLIGTFAGIACGVYYLVNAATAPGILFLGGALVCFGGTVLLFFLCNKLAVWLWQLGKWTVLKTVGLFRRKGGKK